MMLLTDGRNNRAGTARSKRRTWRQKWGIKIYTIGIGSGQAYTTMQTPLGTFRVPAQEELDEKLLKAIAEKTGGFYSRADDADVAAQDREED